MRSLVAVLVLLVAVQAFAYDANETIWNSHGGSYIAPVPGPVYFWERVTLYNNGPVWNAVYGTYNESILQSALGMTTYGFGHAISTGYRMADDFVVPAGETWDVQSITFFAYQTGSTTNPSTFTNYIVQIWKDAAPPSGTVVWGDLVTNRLTASVWSGVHRTLEGSHATNRPIFANTCSVPVQLTAGHYWVDWACAGTLASGPWAPPIVITGQATTGDALQYNAVSLTWGPAIDTGTAMAPQGMPFIIEGAIPTPVEAATWSGVKALYR